MANERSALGHRIDALVAQAEMGCEAEAGFCEAAAMVYIGDVYGLQIDGNGVDSHWGARHYVVDLGEEPL